MKEAIEETCRSPRNQMAYNKEMVLPKTIVKRAD